MRLKEVLFSQHRASVPSTQLISCYLPLHYRDALRSSKASLTSPAIGPSLLRAARRSLSRQLASNAIKDKTGTHRCPSVSLSIESCIVLLCLRTCRRVARGTPSDCVSPMNSRCSILSDLFAKWCTPLLPPVVRTCAREYRTLG
jgi:hypothetical protein